MISLLHKARRLIFSLLRLKTLGAFVIAVDDEGRVLLIRQTYGSPAWSLPGGGVQRYETVRDAALREAKEEVGLRLNPETSAELLGVYLKLQGKWTDQVVVFVVRNWDLEPVANWEVAEHGLFDPDDLPSDVSPAARRRIAEWREGRPAAPCW